MNKETPLIVAGIIFGIMAAIHLIRLFWSFDIVIAGYTIPTSASAVVFVVAAVLSIWMFRASKSRR